MLIGIVKKNAIMMIDFALTQQRSYANISPEQAIYQAAIIRFRPIVMTMMAAMMGTLPIAFGSGMGADSRRPLGVCVAGGLLFSQVLTLYITPYSTHIWTGWAAVSDYPAGPSPRSVSQPEKPELQCGYARHGVL